MDIYNVSYCLVGRFAGLVAFAGRQPQWLLNAELAQRG
jgi:hypothetical protein